MERETSPLLSWLLLVVGWLIALLSLIGGVYLGLKAAQVADTTGLGIGLGAGVAGAAAGLTLMALGSILRFLEELRDHWIPTEDTSPRPVQDIY